MAKRVPVQGGDGMLAGRRSKVVLLGSAGVPRRKENRLMMVRFRGGVVGGWLAQAPSRTAGMGVGQ